MKRYRVYFSSFENLFKKGWIVYVKAHTVKGAIKCAKKMHRIVDKKSCDAIERIYKVRKNGKSECVYDGWYEMTHC